VSSATLPAVAAVEQPQPPANEGFYRPAKPRAERARFDAAQQAVLDREIVRAKRKAAERFHRAADDIRELVWACEQLLYKKLSQEQAQDIAKGVQEIKAEYGEAKCQKR
jgi:hypothetical protein